MSKSISVSYGQDFLLDFRIIQLHIFRRINIIYGQPHPSLGHKLALSQTSVPSLEIPRISDFSKQNINQQVCFSCIEETGDTEVNTTRISLTHEGQKTTMDTQKHKDDRLEQIGNKHMVEYEYVSLWFLCLKIWALLSRAA